MKRFQFRLDSVRRYREYLEHKARLDLSAALLKMEESRERIRQLSGLLQDRRDELDRMTAAGIGGGKLLRYSEYLASLDLEIEMEREREKELQSVVVDKQKALHKRSIEKKVLENLKENRKIEYDHEAIKENQHESDEMTLIRRVPETGTR